MCCQNNTYDLKNVSSVKQNFSKEKLLGGGGGGGGGIEHAAPDATLGELLSPEGHKRTKYSRD